MKIERRKLQTKRADLKNLVGEIENTQKDSPENWKISCIATAHNRITWKRTLI